MTRLLRLGTCTVCGTGNVGVRTPASGAGVVAMCDECDAVWLDKHRLDGPHFPAQPDLPNPKDGTSLREPPAHWATADEVAAEKWADVVLGETEALG